MSDLLRCPFVRAVAEGRIDDATRIAAKPPDPAEPVVIEWLIGEARRQLGGDAVYAARSQFYDLITNGKEHP